MKAHLQYFKAVCRHKWFVFLACLYMRVPIWSAILHDWDKFLPDEWFPYVHTFYAPDGSKQYKESIAFARAWMLHQHRNKHHWQYWLWVQMDSHNTAIPLRETDYLVWDRGNAQRVVKRNSGGTEWYELQEPYPADSACCPDPMPDRARREMVADWMGAGRAYVKNWTRAEPLKWYEKNKDKMQLHPETRVWVEAQLTELKQLYELEERLKGMGIIT